MIFLEVIIDFDMCITNSWNKITRDAGREMEEGIREVFEKAMNDLFNQKILPLVNTINYLIKERTEDIGKIGGTFLSNLDRIKNEVKGNIEKRSFG